MNNIQTDLTVTKTWNGPNWHKIVASLKIALKCLQA